MTLDAYRRRIDSIDEEILILLNRRAENAQRIGELKVAAGLSVVDREREERVLRRAAELNEGKLSDDAAIRIFGLILHESRQIQFQVAADIALQGELQK